MCVTGGFRVEKRIGNNLGPRLVPQKRDHCAGIEDEDHDCDSSSRSSIFLRMNDSLVVGTCRYLPLMELTSCFRSGWPESLGASIAARTDLNSWNCSGPRPRTASTIACTCSDTANEPCLYLTASLKAISDAWRTANLSSPWACGPRGRSRRHPPTPFALRVADRVAPESQ